MAKVLTFSVVVQRCVPLHHTHASVDAHASQSAGLSQSGTSGQVPAACSHSEHGRSGSVGPPASPSRHDSVDAQ